MGYDLVHETLGGADDLSDSPSLLLSTAQASPDAVSAYGNAQTASQAANYNATVQAVKKNVHHASNNHWNVLGDVAHLFQDPLGSLKQAGGEALQALSKPLESVQHEYRYIKDVYHHHGAVPALAEGLRLAGGAAVGVAAAGAVVASGGTLAPVVGAGIGAGASTLFPHGGDNALTGYKDSWDRSLTASGSPGRDFAGLLHFDPAISIAGHKAHLLSGTFDAVFDIATDPTLKAGNALLAANRARYALKAPEDLAEAYAAAPKVQRAVDDIVATNSPSQLLERYPSLGPQLAQKLARANSKDDVFQAYADIFTRDAYLSWEAPKLSFIRGNMARPIKDRLAQLGIDTRSSEQHVADIVSGAGLPAVDASGNLVPGAADLQSAAGRSQTLQRGFERAYRRITTHLPLQTDIQTGKQSVSKIKVESPESIPVIRDWAKFGNNTTVAKGIADAYAAAPTDLRWRIIRNLEIASFVKMGAAEDPELLKRLIQNADEEMNRMRGFYGTVPAEEAAGMREPYDDGFNVHVKTPSGDVISVPASIWTSQQGLKTLPDFREVRRGMDYMRRLRSPGVIATTLAKGDAQKAAQWSLTPYRFDDFMYNNITRNFKRLALSTGGFALRIGSGEALREILNQGWTKYANAKLADIGSRYGIMIRNGETASGFRDRIAALAYANAGKLYSTDRDALDFMIESQFRNDGHALPSMIDGQHNQLDMIESRPDRQAQFLGKTAQKTYGRREGDWRLFRKDESNFALMHRGAVEQVINANEGPKLAQIWKEELANNPTSQQDAISATIRRHAQYMADNKRSFSGMLRGQDQALLDNGGYAGYAGTQLRALRGLTEGPSLDADGKLLPHGRNNDLIDAIAAKRLPTEAEFQGYHPQMVPEMVHGQELDPYMESRVDRLFNAFHHKVTGPVLNSLSRKPTFALRGSQELKRLKPYIGTQAEIRAGAVKEIEAGGTTLKVPLISHEDAMDIAEHRAALSMLPDIHNPRLRTQFHQIMDNYAPFLFAKQQAWQRWGRLALKDPNMLRRLEILHSGMKNIGFIQKDEATGDEYFAYPNSGFVGGVLTKGLNKVGIHTLDGVPLTFRGSMTSFKSIIPGTEEETGLGLGGPLFFTSMKALENYAPETAPIVEQSLGQFSSSPVWTEILPNPVIRNLVYAYAGDHSRAFQSAEMFALQYYMSQHPEDFLNPDPRVQSSLLARAKNLARVIYIMKAALGEGLPAAPQFQIGKPQLTQEFLGYLEKSHNYAEALDAFRKANKNIKDVTPFTVFQSQGLGISIPPSEQALRFFQDHRDLLASLPDGGAYLIPQDSKASSNHAAQAIYNEQVALGMRHKKSPEQFLTDLYAAHGDALYYKKQREVVEARKNAQGNQYDLDQINADWNTFKENLSLQNPTWADKHFGQNAGVKKDRAITQLQALYTIDNGAHVPKTEQSNLVGGLLREYAAYKQSRDALDAYSQTRGVRYQKQQIDLQWQNRLTTLMNTEPRLIPVIQGLFFDKSIADQEANA